MSENTHRILIVYSVKGTSPADLNASKNAIRRYSVNNPSRSCEPVVFNIPPTATPGGSLPSDLYKELRSSLGAIVFIDDMRPNIAYELGFFHGQGRPVVLITRKRVTAFWRTLSDLAGGAIANIKNEEMNDVIANYLTSLYSHLSNVPARPTWVLPAKDKNMLSHQNVNCSSTYPHPERIRTKAEWGPALTISDWQHVDHTIEVNLTSQARFHLVFKGARNGTDYTIYFHLRYVNLKGRRKTIWMAFTCNAANAGIDKWERSLPAKQASTQWQSLQGRFDELLAAGLVLDVDRLEVLHKIRFRAGNEINPSGHEYCVGFMQILGADR